MVRSLLCALVVVAGAGPARGAEAETATAPPASQPAGGGAAEAKPLGFNEAVQRALARNPSVTVAQEEIRRAEALVRQSRAGSLPTLYANATYTRLDAARTMASTGYVVAEANQWYGNLTLSVPLVQAQRWAAWSHARDNVEVSRFSARDVRRQIAVATARAYLAVVTQKRVLDVNVRARETARAHHDYAHARRRGGVGNRIDEVRAAQELATTEATVEAAEAGLAKAREALGVLVGAESPVDTADEPLLPGAGPVPQALEEAERSRADVLAARARRRAAERVLRDSWTDFMPSLVGNFQPFFQDPPSLVLPKTGWQATLTLSWALYDGGLRYGQRRERAALVAEANAALDAALRQARSDVRTAAEAVRRADASLTAARKAALLARQALELSTLAYRAGATTNIEVIDAERRARDAETTAAIAEDNARQARLDLLAASGKFP
ncbi:MAG: TolC family protein [Deltaproteobacteria bacterium]|nr:TolC family protein [Deltaproteobacteria bacterium]